MAEKIKSILLPNISRFAWGVGLLYAVFGGLWIIASDALVSSISSDPSWVAAAQRYKGILYVGITSLGLIFLVSEGYRRLLKAVSRAEATELQVRDLFSHHPTPMWVYDRETLGFVAVNEAAAQYYGYSRDALLTMNLADLCLPEDIAPLRALMQGAQEGPQDIGVVRHRKKSGDVVFAHLTAHPVEFMQHKAKMVMAIDVTADILSKHALERQEAQFRQLHQSLSCVLWMASADGRRMLYVSPAVEPVCGLTPEAMRANPALWLKMIHPEDTGAATACAARLQATGASSCEYRIRTLSGQTKWVLDRKRLIVDGQGLVTMVGGILEDITAEKAHEALADHAHARQSDPYGAR